MRRPLGVHSGFGLLALSAVASPAFLAGQALDLRLVDGEIHMSAPALHFLEGPVAERLRNGAPATFSLSLSVATDHQNNVLKRVTERFVLSYDLWEEKFGAALPRRKLGPVAHRTPGAAENWCFSQLTLQSGDLPEDRSLWFRLEVQQEESSPDDSSTPMSLRGLIDAFGRTRSKPATRWTAESGPIFIKDLRGPRRTQPPRLVAWVP